jgi:hypothetical protein
VGRAGGDGLRRGRDGGAVVDRGAGLRLGGPEARPGLRARVDQLRGNLEHLRGRVDAAIGWYERAARDFAAAGESIGRTLLAANLAALAIVGGDVERGLVHGRAALRGYLALGRVQALPELAVNLVQLLVRVGSFAEAQRLGLPCCAACSRGASAGRWRRRAAGGSTRSWRSGRGCGASGSTCRRPSPTRPGAGGGRSDPRGGRGGAARVRAGAAGGRVDVAARHLAAARAIGDGRARRADLLVIGLEALALAAATGGRESFAAACAALARLPRPEALVAAGRLELAWRYDQVVAALLPPGDRRRRALERRMQETWDALMRKVPPLDRAAVRAALIAESGERRAGTRSEARRPERAGARSSGDGGGMRGAGALELEEQDMSEQSTLDEGGDPQASLADVLGDMSEVPAEPARGGRATRTADPDLPSAGPRGRPPAAARAGRRRGDGPVRRGAWSGGCGGGRGASRGLRASWRGAPGVAFSRSIIERVLAQGAAVLSVDAVADDRFDGSRSISHLNLRSVLAVPLLHRGEAIGAVYVDHRLRRGAWGEADLVLVEEFAELAALAIAHARTLAEQRAQGEALAAQGRELARLLEERELEVRGLREAARTPERRSYRGMVGGTPAMQAVFRLIDRLADSDVPVVIFGESGTGKELVARAIHDAGARKGRAFVAENCGAIPEALLESVLFGHAKGAFTGAHRATPGLFEAADGGTIFLDEIGEMSPGMQTKLLRVLQEGELRRVGDTATRKIEVRVIAASNRDLEAMVAAGTFRKDLLYRIRVVKIELPPLREPAGGPDDAGRALPGAARQAAAVDGERGGDAGAGAVRLAGQHPRAGERGAALGGAGRGAGGAG